jgi:MOSC domain-containing protein YiiM
MHRSMTELETGLSEIQGSPRDEGRIEMIVRRPIKGQREVLEEGLLTLDEGLAGDCWKRHSPHPEMQINIMNSRAIALVAGSRERWALAGDQLFVDLDLSETNLPPGTTLELGSAVLEITAKPHTGCSKFAARFGQDAVQFVNSVRGKELHLRGLNARVVRSGAIRKGDIVRKVGLNPDSKEWNRVQPNQSGSSSEAS